MGEAQEILLLTQNACFPVQAYYFMSSKLNVEIHQLVYIAIDCVTVWCNGMECVLRSI